MLIGELSKRSGLSRDTIRFYEKHGLIAVGTKERRFNNYKEYSEETFQRLQSVKLIKSFGFTLNETADLLDLIAANEATCTNVAEKITDKVQLIDEKIKELIHIRTLLLNGLKSCQDNSCTATGTEENCPIIIAKE